MGQEKSGDSSSQSGADYAVQQGSDIIGGVIDGVIDAFNPFSSGSSDTSNDDSDDDK